MTQPDDFRPDDRRLRAALRTLPAERAGEGFTEEVLARLGERAGRTAAPAPPRARVRWRQLALTAAAAAAALAVAVGGDGLWPAGPWLWIGGGVGKGGEQAHAGATAGSEAGGEAAARPAGAPAESASRAPRRGAGVDDGAAKGGGGTSGAAAAPRAPKGGADAGDGAVVDGTAAAAPGDRAAARPGTDGSGSTAGGPASGRPGRRPTAGSVEGGPGRTGGTGARGRAREPARAPASAPAAASRAGDPQRHEDAPSRGLVTTGARDSASATNRDLAASSARPLGEERAPAGRSGSAGTTAAAQDLTGTQVAARLAALRDERERLLADLRALRAATPPEEPAGLLLAGGESIDVVLGLAPAAARPTGGDGGVRPAALPGDDRTPRLY